MDALHDTQPRESKSSTYLRRYTVTVVSSHHRRCNLQMKSFVLLLNWRHSRHKKISKA